MRAQTAQRRFGLLLILAGAAFMLLAGSASAASPWWHLSSATRPTYLQGGLAHNEVQKVLVNATGGQFILDDRTPEQIQKEEFENEATGELLFVFLPVGASASEVQSGLETLYGSGNVEVSEEAPGSYVVTFVGALTDQPVAPIGTNVNEAFGLEAEISVTELAKGRPDGEVYLTALNLGTANVDGSKAPVQLKDVLPPGLKAVGIAATKPDEQGNFQARRPIPCSLGTLTCTLDGPLAPFDNLEMRIAIVVEGAETGELNEVSVSGGGAQSASFKRAITISSKPVPFGVENLEMALEEEGGSAPTQAAAHPFQFTTAITLNQNEDIHSLDGGGKHRPEVIPTGVAKDLSFNLPAGLIGNPKPLPQCTTAQFFSVIGGGKENRCPPESVVGVAVATVHEPAVIGTSTLTEPIFNMEPNYGEPARFAFYITIANQPIFIDTSVRSGSDYGITAIVRNTTQTAAFLSGTATFWGTPGDPRHDGQRGWGCLYAAREVTETLYPCTSTKPEHPPAFFSMPTRCDAPLAASVEVNSWEERMLQSFPGLFAPALPLEGCNQVPFSPAIESHPSADSGETGSGLDVNVDINDEGLLNSKGLAQSQAKKAVVTLPEGLTINPSVGEGLGVCTPAQYDRESVSSAPGEGCPNSSKLGTLEVITPLVDESIDGSVYLAQEDDKATSAPGAENPFDSLIALYLVLKNPKLGVMIKKPLKVEPDSKTGQLVATIEDVPQLPFSHFNFHFREGARAPLITPAACGTYTTQAKFYPWSAPENPKTVTDSFQITRGVGGGPCPSGGVPPFHPHFEAGALNNNAGSFSPFNMRLLRSDGEQDMTKFSSILPPGELGSLAGVSKCPDSAIAVAKSKTGRQEKESPSCPANSLIGHTLAGAGVGEALTYVPGQVYLGGPYHGDPLSVISVTPALAGPFDAGTVVVQLALNLNPKTAEVEVDGANSDPIPHILDGIVLKLRDLRVYVDRQNFTLNPTSCEESKAKATLFGSNLNVFDPADDVPVSLSSRYQAANCASLGFKPRLSLDLNGGSRRGGHPGLVATYSPRKGDANVKSLVVRLPRSAFLDQGHIRTICTRVQFAAKSCPAGAQYGFIKAWTPLLDEPLEGPVWLRSSNHKLPDLVFDLHGLVDVEVATRIDSSHGGIRATVESAPDAPLSKVLLRMQGGKKGLIINSRNLCGATSKANVEFIGHNGKESKANPVMKADCGGKGGHKRHQKRS